MAGNENLSSTGTDSSNGNLNDGSPKASDTKITKTWQAVETLDSWWNVNWQYRKKITFVEPGLMDRDRDPMNVYVTFTGNEARVNSLRVVLFRDSTTWVEISSQVWNATTHNAGGIFYYDRCTVFFLLNMTKADTEIYYLYYDPAISTAPSYANRIDIRGRDTAMANDNVNPSFTHLNGTAYNNVDSLQVIVDGNTANPRAAVALVDTVRAGSDWGGPCNSIYSARYGNADALNLAQSTYMSVGEMALQASSAADPFDGAAERINVGPDNVAEAWDGRGAITVLDDGPLFTRVKIQTTDGAYASLANLGSGAANGWYRDYIYNTRYAQVDTASRGVTGGNGYVKYNITYTFYYYGLQTFAKIDLDIGAYPQRGPTGGVPHIDYPLEAANYLRPTNVNFKNYGDWPHLAQLVRGNAGTVAQDRKAWIGSKYGLYNMDIAARRRDYPLEPWTAWYDTATDPTVGMFSVTNSIGWEVTSLAVAGIGPNSLLQQILPEGHQGDIFTIPNNTIYYYDYYLLTSANGMNWSEVRDMCRRTNAPVSVTVSNRELFAHNGLFIHTNDLNGNMALGTRVRLSNASGIVYDEFVNNVGNVTFLRLSDGQYTTRVYFYTPNLLNEYLVRSETFTLNHLVNRSTYRNYNCNMANLSFDVVNWARSNEPLTGVLIRLRNVTTSALVEQNFTWNGFVDFRLYTTGTTQYNLEFVYGGQVRSANITNPYTLPGNRNLNVGLAIETTAITINSQSASVILGQNYQVSFYFHKSGDLATKYGAQSVTVSSQFAADYWTPTTHYVWWNAGANLIGLNLTSGPGTRLTTSGIFSVYIHAINNTMETATEKLFVVVNPIPTTIRLTMNDSSVHQIEVSKSGKVLLEVDYINAQSGLDLTTATVNYTLNSVTTSMSPYNAGNGNYTALIDTSTLDFTTYAVTIRAWQANYVVAVDAVVFIIIARPSSMALTSPGNVFFGENFTIDIDLTDGLNGSGIITSIPRFSEDVKSYPAISGTFTGVSAGHYRLTYNSRDFPGLLTFTIYVIWTAPNTYPFYQSRNTSTTVRIVQRDAVLTYDPVGNIPFRENVSVNMRYEDGINATGITPATVNTNITTYTLTNLGSGNYRFTLNSTTLSATLGTYYARITMIWNPVNRPYYENQTVIVKIVVVSRATQLVVSDPPAATEYRQNIAFSVIYSDLLSGARLSGAGRVTIASTNTSINLPVLQGDNSYRITLNSSVFAAPGVYYVPITATWIGGSPYYTNNLVSVKITVVQRSSQVTYDSLAPTPYRNNFTFYVNFLDGLNGNPISGATFSTNLTNPTHFTRTVISLGRYMISINTTEVRATTGDSYVIIYVNAPAGSPFYANGQITIRMSVTQRPTVLSYTSLQPTPYNQPVVFTMNFRDSERGTGVYQGVTVSSNGTLDSAVNLNNGFYTITIRAGTLSIGTHSVLFTFTTPAAAPFYQSNSLAISIQITARSTQIVYSGLSPTSYGGWFDFTIQVQDSLSSTALNGLSAGAFTSNSTSFAFLSEVSPGNYRINISTTELGHVGSVKYRITATPGGNYASTSSTIPFTSTNRAIALSAGSVTPTSFSVNVVFQVQYRDGITSSGLVGHASYITSSHSGSVSEIGSGIYQITVPAASFAALGSYTVTVQANWPAAISPFYANASISVPVSIIPRGAGLTVDKEANVQFGEDMTVNIAFQDAVNGSYINIPLSRIKISVIGYSNVTIINSSVGTGRYQSKISTYPLPRTGDYVVNVSTTWPGTPFYYNLSRTVTVTVSQRSTMFYPGGEIYLTRGFNVLFNVSLYYLDVINGSTITRASSVSRYVSATDYTHANIPTVNSTGTMMTYQSTVGWYATFNSSHFGNPSLYAYVVTMQFNWSKTAKPFYMNRTISFNISITAAQTQVIVLGSFVAPSGQNHTLDFQYINSESGKEIDLAIVRVNNTITGTPIRYTGITIWNGTAAWNGSHYRLVFNVTALPGSLHPFNITFSKTNYNTITYVFTLVDTALGSELTTQSIQANRILGQNISMVMVYKYQGSTNGILNAYLNVSSNVSSIYWAPSEFSYTSLGNGAYNLTIKDTGESATRIKVAGFHQVYIKMWSNTTEERVINVQFEMKQVPTNISRLYFNGTRFINPLPSYSTQITKNVNITIDFVRLFPGAQNITSGTTVFLTSSSLSSNRNLTLIGNQYVIVLPVSALGIGTHFLFVIGQRANHQQSTKSLQIIVTQVSTSLNLYLNTTANSSIQVKYGQFINVSAQYRNIIDSVYITDPLTTVTVTGGSLGIISWTLAAVGSYWQYNLDSRLLGTPTSYTMTISASLANYTISPKVFTIQVIEVPTTMINVNGSAITVMWRSIFRIYVAYRTYTGTAVPGAIMSTTTANVGTGFNTTHYWAEFNATAFGSIQVHNLGISLSRANYTGQSVTISVDVRAITTTAQTFQSAGNAATDFSVYWLNTIDVIVQYTDTVHAVNITSTTISAGIYNGAIVSNTYASGNYTLRFSSTLLGNPGVYVISLSISRATFESKIIVITIQVNEPTTSLIVTDVNGNSLSGASVSWGEPFVFVARLWDSVHSANITGWTASFSRPPIGNVVSGPNRTITYNWLTPGIYTITVTGVLDPYPSASAAITLVVNTITTELRSYAYNGGLSDTFTSSWGSTINVTLQYRNTFNSTIINPALASITTTSASKVISTVQNVQNKTFLFNASLFVPGVYTINFEASRTNYNYDSVAITFTVTSLNTTLETYEVLSNVVSHSFVATWGTLVSFDVAFNQTGTQVAYARVPGVISAAPAWTSSANSPVGGKLRVTYDTSLFAAPSINSITITAQYQNRTIRSISVTLTINTVSTRISTFNAVNVNTTSFNVFWNENVAIDVMYQTISGTNITTLPATIITTTPLVPASMVDSLIYPGRKTLTFSTSTLTAQTYQVTITARLQNYTASSIYILINVQTRTTNATVHSTSGPEQYSFNVYYGDMLNVDVRYYDMLNGTSISNAGGATISSTPAESANGANGIYRRLTYNTASFTLGLHMVLISCSRGARYAEAQVVIFITVQAVPTRVSIFNATSGAPSTAFKATWNTLFQVSVAFDRTYAPVGPLPGATFVVNVPYQSVSYAAGRYLFTFNSSRIGSPDIYSITFTASLANYVTSANSSTLEVLRVSTVLQSYAQGGGLKAQFSIEWGKILTFTGRYHLALSPFTALHPTSMTPLNFPGSIILGNVGNGENITFSMNSSSFGGTGIFTSTFIMSRTNYTENSMQVTIEVVALDSRVNLLINSTSSPSLTNITVSRQYYVPFENLITIRVQYLTQLGSMPISNARVMVRFIERSINWTNYPGGNNTISNKSNGQYDLTLNTLDDLGDFGQYSFVVVISKQNYTMESEPFYVYPIKLQTKLDIFTSTWANVTNGQKFTVNFTKSLVLYCALWDISKSKYINTTYGVVFTAVMKGVTYTPVTIYTNGTALFRFNTSAINVDVGTSNFISFTGSAGIYNPSGGSVNLEVLTVPTLARAFNSTTGSSVIQGSTIPLYYTRNFTIDVSYTDILNSANITNLNTGARIYAKVYAQEINATWVGGGKWRILFDSNTMPVTTGSIPQITIYGTYVNYTTATFLFNLWLREINTTITVYNDLRPYGGNLVKINDSIEVNWSDSVTLVVYYNNTLTNLPIGTWGSPSTYPLVQATFGISPVYTNTGLFSPALYSQVDIDSSWLRGGNTHTIIVTGNKQNFIGAEFRFNLVVKEVPTRLYVMNDSGYLTEGQTVQIYYGDTLHLNASYQNLITGANVSIAGPTIRAVILGTAINAVNLFNGNWSIDINTGIIVGLRSGSTPQIVVTATYLNHSQATFSFNMQVLDIPTDLIIPTQFQSVVQFIWGQAFAFSVKYNDTHNNLLINGSLVSNYPSMSITFNGSDYMLVFNTTSIGAPGIYRITLTASKQNYASASYTITVQILEVPTNMVVLFNGLTFIQVSLKQNLTIAVNYTRSSDGSPVQGALVTLSFTNDTSGTLLPYTLIYVSGLYVTTIPLDLATFYAQPKFMIVQAFRANYTIGKSNPVVDLRPIEIIGHQNQNLDDPAQTLITGLVPGSTITFDFQLFDNSTDLGWLNASQLVINITCAELHIYNQQMGYVGNGTFRDTIELPSGYDKTYTIILDVYAPGELTRQFRFQNTYTYRFQTETYTGSVIPEWVFYLILAALIGVVIYFVLYQVRFKYPPIVRKIHDLQRNVRRGRAAAKIAPQRVASREEGIYSEFAKILDEYSFLATHAKAMGAKAKEAKAKKGYVAPEEDTLAKEFDLAPKEKVIEIKSVAPAIFPKEGPKKYTELPSIPAPAATPALPAIPKPAAPVVSVPFAPAVPKPAAPAIPGPVTPAMPKIPAIPEVPGTKKVASIAALPKPAAKPLPTKPGAAPEGEGQEGLYGELVKLEQKKYKAQRSLRDLKAKKDKGILTDEEFQQYQVKFEEALEKINEKIAEIRRKLVNF